MKAFGAVFHCASPGVPETGRTVYFQSAIAARVEKYLSFYKEKNVDYQILAWDRLNVGVTCENLP
jgi:hypothetical protein